ncbi:MAG: hypothetical protein KatS3mg024_2172 [Armatimonadota bacterium]|nr:MAG: hypothetical protein KatS3mg024_2172 [Armatimonadota bacterium]
MLACVSVAVVSLSRLSEAPVADPIIRQIQELEPVRQPSHRVILFNDDYHTMDEVVLQIQKATGYSLEKSEAIMWEAHTRGQAVVYCGDLEDCNRVASVLEEIGLRVAIEPV